MSFENISVCIELICIYILCSQDVPVESAEDNGSDFNDDVSEESSKETGDDQADDVNEKKVETPTLRKRVKKSTASKI